MATKIDRASPRRGHGSQNGVTSTGRVPQNAFLFTQNPKHVELLNTLIELQSLEIESHFDLPQIIVCGSQSSGKSSVLEAITEIPFPRSSSTCTRFVTKVTLKPHVIELVEVKIVRSDLRMQDSTPRFPPITDTTNLAVELEKQFKLATEAILGNQKETKFSKDFLSITISGPKRPVLQILDLPGLINYDAADNRNPQFVQELVASEMKKANSTILAVLAANFDFQNQGVLSLCQQHDSEGERTIGIITRPDTAEKVQAETCVAIAQNKRKEEVGIKHDWHVIRNRNPDELSRGTSTEERDEAEARFLRQEPWAKLGSENLGIVTLRSRLSKILLEALNTELPKLAKEVERQLKDISSKLGGDEIDPQNKRNIFSDGAERLKNRTNLYVQAKYQYDTSHLEAFHPIHIRSRIVEQSELFRDRIIDEGHEYSSQLEPEGINPNHDLKSLIKKSRVSPMAKRVPISKPPEVEIAEAKKYLDEKRGTELPGTFNPDLINDFFWKQSRSWNSIADEHIGKVFEHCILYFKEATKMDFAPDPLQDEKRTFPNHGAVVKNVMNMISNKIEIMKAEATEELRRIEIDRTMYQLNFNPKYQAEYRQQRNARNARRAINAVVKDAALQNKDSKRPVPELNPNTLAELQNRHTQKDRTEEEAEDFLKAAWLQYKYMRDSYIANVVTQVIERHFMRKLSKLVPDVRLLDDAVFTSLVVEDSNTEEEREKLKKDREMLQKCLRILKESRWT